MRIKIITLNAWGGRHSDILKFIDKHKDADIFCLQEVYKEGLGKMVRYDTTKGQRLDLFWEVHDILCSHTGFFRPNFLGCYGLAVFVKKPLRVKFEGAVFVHKHEYYLPPKKRPAAHARNLQYVILENPSLAILNFHGIWNGNGKTDTSARIAAARKVKALAGRIPVPKVLAGDFNLRPDTKSLAIMGQRMRDLVSEFGVPSTRTCLYEKKEGEEREEFADYVFTSPSLKVYDFRVLPDVVSDHAPLLLEVEA